MNMHILLQRLEGAVILVGSLYLYHQSDANLLLIALLILAPDLSMLGYLKGPKLGAIIYNLGHSLVLPGLIALAYLITGHPIPSLLYIWFAHIGLDRLFGYGLKLPAGFRHTHLGEIGRN